MEEALVKSIREVEPHHWWFQARRTIARDFIRDQILPRLDLGDKAPKILDIGAGTGFMAESLTDFGDVDALEFDATSLEALRGRRRVHVVEDKLPSKDIAEGSYDLVTSFDVFEHIDDDAMAMTEAGRVLRPGGLALLTVPAHPFLWTQHDEVNHHFRRYRAKEFKDRATDAGLVVEFFSPHLSLLFPVFLLQRLMHQIMPPKQASTIVKRPMSLVNSVLYLLYSIESVLLRRRASLPFGASYLMLVRKPVEGEEAVAAHRQLGRWDPRRVLSSPKVYSFFRTLVTGHDNRKIFVGEYLKPKENDRILDIGCGPADILADLPESVDYVGLDMTSAYILSAKERWGERAQFICKRVDEALIGALGPKSFDIVVAHGLLHHLSDEQALHFFKLAKDAMKPGARLVMLDGCYVDGQSWMTRYLLSKDRGHYVREREAYMDLARQVFDKVEGDIRHDMYRIPYTVLIMQCSA